MEYEVVLVKIVKGPPADQLEEGKRNHSADPESTQSITLRIKGIEKELVIHAKEAAAIYGRPPESPDFVKGLLQPVAGWPSFQRPQLPRWWKMIGKTELIHRTGQAQQEAFFGYYNAACLSGYALIAFKSSEVKPEDIKSILPQAEIRSKPITEEQFEELCLKW